jgi:hypothetical protein
VDERQEVVAELRCSMACSAALVVDIVPLDVLAASALEVVED